MKALLIGNSDGIGLNTTKELLKMGWEIIGISRSESPIKNISYKHNVISVTDKDYVSNLKLILDKEEFFDLCIYCVGIGELLKLTDMDKEVEIVNVNLLGMIKTVSCLIPEMVKKGKGHFIGLSSLADILPSKQAPAYHASKAGFSAYLESLALAVRPEKVFVTNVRFGFVDTKMAKGDVKPFMISVEKATKHLLKCIRKKPVRYTAPGFLVPIIKVTAFFANLKY